MVTSLCRVPCHHSLVPVYSTLLRRDPRPRRWHEVQDPSDPYNGLKTVFAGFLDAANGITKGLSNKELKKRATAMLRLSA